MSKRKKIVRVQLVRVPGQGRGEVITLRRRSNASGIHQKRTPDRANTLRRVIEAERES